MKHKHHVNSYIAYSLISLSVLSTIMLSSSLSSVSAESVPASVTITASCTITTTGSTTHSATIIPGNYTEIVSNAIDVSCNDAGGYAIYAIGFGGDSYTASNRNKLISSLNSSYDIITNNTGSASYWAMKVTPSGTNAPTVDNSYNIYQQIPDTFTEISHYTSSTLGTNNSVTTPTYKVNISANQPAGSYTGKVKYVLTHPNTATPANNMFTVVYNSNGGTGSMTSSSFYTFDDNILTTNSFTAPTGYAFKNWCTVQDQTQTPQTTCTGTTYTDGGAVPSGTVSAGNTLTLYAVWESAAPAKLYMQDLDKTTCQTLTASGPITVYDRRDESDYTVRYINDACWMTQNLRITGTISATDSNFSTQSSWNVHVNDLTSGNTYTEARSHVADAASVTAASDAGYTTTLDGKTVTAEILGAWYNYCAASAGTVCAQTQTNASEDICPANWHLPIYNTDTTNYPIGNIYGMTGSATADGTNNASLFNPVYGGYYNGGTLNYAGLYGRWWSATASDTSNQYSLDYGNGSLAGINNKRYGSYIRCVRTS